MATAEINGTTITYTDTGGDKPVILFSHGFMMDHTMFDAQVAAFKDDYRCVAWDERGFGATRATGPFTYWDSADDAVGLLDHLGIESAIFAGMSQGGFLSLRAALTHPSRVRAVVMIDSAADNDDEETLKGYYGLLHVMQNGSDDERQAVFEVVAGLILGDAELAAEWIPRWEQIDRHQLFLAGENLLGREDVTDRMGEITCPMFAIHGSADQSIVVARAEALTKVVPDHRGVVVIEGGAHAANMSHPDQFNAALRDFLATL